MHLANVDRPGGRSLPVTVTANRTHVKYTPKTRTWHFLTRSGASEMHHKWAMG